MPTAPQQSSQLEQELAEVKGHLRSAEEQNGELAEQLKVASASVEQYRAVVLTLEDSLKKEKEVRPFVSGCSFQSGKTTDINKRWRWCVCVISFAEDGKRD